MTTFRKRLLICLVAALPVACLCYDHFLLRPNSRNAIRGEAMDHCRELSSALRAFKEKYGAFPSEETMRKVAAEKHVAEFPLVTSNDYIRLLVAAGVLSSEKAAHCRPTKKPDAEVSPFERAFAKGECGFTYVAGLDADSDWSAPILLTPVVPGTRRFDGKIFSGYAFVVRVDGSVVVMKPGKNDIVTDGSGKNIFDRTAEHWNGKEFELKYPEP